MGLLWLTFYVTILIGVILFIEKFWKKKFAANFLCILWKILVIKLILSFVFPIISFVTKTIAMQERDDITAQYMGFGIFENVNKIVIGVWLSVSFVLFALFFGKYFVFLKKVKKNSNVLHFSCNKTKNFNRVQLRGNSALSSPVTFGIWTPSIIVPDYFFDMKKESQEYLFYHEICHIRHKDTLWKMLAVFVALIYWFNPFIWIMLKHIEMDMELCCDYEVLSELGGKIQYAELLLDFAKRKQNIYVLNGFGESVIHKRVTSILNYEKEERKKLFSTIVILFFSCLVFFVRLDFIDSMSDVVMQPEEDDPLYRYQNDGIKYMRGAWRYKGRKIAGLVDIGYCIYVNEEVEDGQWLEIIRAGNGKIKIVKEITEDQAWEIIQQ